MNPVQAYVGLGSNLDSPQVHVMQALADLEGLPASRVCARSRLYATAPQGSVGQPGYVNAVAQLETRLSAQELLERLLDIERQHGRVRSVRNAARTLDLDLLLYGRERIDTPALQVPHPRMHERAFVLRPLLEVDPGLRIPGQGPAAALLEKCAGQAVQAIEPTPCPTLR